MAGNMTLISPAFDSGESIPVKHTCDGANVSPPLVWHNVPDGTKSLALICDDPDAPRGTWSHWVLYNIPPNRTELPEGVPTDGKLGWGGLQGRNDFGNIGYGGPCPPRGPAHRYFFRLAALDVALDLGPGLTRQQILNHVAEHRIDQAELMGRYQRR
jgi:Raf kinase inhibitor-like YbhB/YbcL family protein